MSKFNEYLMQQYNETIGEKATSFIVNLVLRLVKDPANMKIVADEVKRLINFENLPTVKSGEYNKNKLRSAVASAIDAHPDLKFLAGELRSKIADIIMNKNKSETPEE